MDAHSSEGHDRGAQRRDPVWSHGPVGKLSSDLRACFRDSLGEQSLDVNRFVPRDNRKCCAGISDTVRGGLRELGRY
jgi:hypothetical protein